MCSFRPKLGLAPENYIDAIRLTPWAAFTSAATKKTALGSTSRFDRQPSRPVVDPVWDLLAYTLDRTGPSRCW